MRLKLNPQEGTIILVHSTVLHQNEIEQIHKHGFLSQYVFQLTILHFDLFLTWFALPNRLCYVWVQMQKRLREHKSQNITEKRNYKWQTRNMLPLIEMMQRRNSRSVFSNWKDIYGGDKKNNQLFISYQLCVNLRSRKSQTKRLFRWIRHIVLKIWKYCQW